MDIIISIILGIVQGITEWLPISSTGHLLLVDEFLHMNVSADFMNMFKVVIQLASVIAVIVLYFHKLNPFSPKNSAKQRWNTIELWMKVVVACIPSAVGLFIDDIVDEKLSNYVVISLMLIIYGILFIVIEKWNKQRSPRVTKLKELTYWTALGIGCFQVLAMVPGTSRSGATIVGALLIGVARPVAAEFTFFLAIPTMVAASGLKLLKFGFHYTGQEIIILLVGCVVSFLVSVFAIKFLMGYIKKHDFTVFGYYRIILGVVVLAYFLIFV